MSDEDDSSKKPVGREAIHVGPTHTHGRMPHGNGGDNLHKHGLIHMRRMEEISDYGLPLAVFRQCDTEWFQTFAHFLTTRPVFESD